MAKIAKATRAAYAALTTFTGVREGEDVLIVADESGLEENGEIADALCGIARQMGANPTLTVINDVEPGSEVTLPEAVTAGMESTDVLIGLTMSTAASVTHHELPDRLREEGKIRSLVMIKRSFETLTSQFALDADYDEILEIGDAIAEVFNDGEEIRVTADNGMDFTMGIDEHGTAHAGGFAHEPGGFTTMTWGEYGQAPNVGSASGTMVIDGPILGYGWPSPPIQIEMEDGVVVDVSGDPQIASSLQETIETTANAENLAEIALGTNPLGRQSDSDDINIVKKSLGTAHTAIGSGAAYGQAVDSPVHIDMVMMEPTVEIDGTTLLESGEFVLDVRGEN